MLLPAAAKQLRASSAAILRPGPDGGKGSASPRLPWRAAFQKSHFYQDAPFVSHQF